MANSNRLGELLVRENMISAAQLQHAQEEARAAGRRIGYTLTKLGLVDEGELTSFLSRQYGVPSINLKDFEIDPKVIQLIPRHVAERHQVIPVKRTGSTMVVAMADPSDLGAIDDLKFLTNYSIEVVVAAEAAVQEAIERYYAKKVSYDDIISDMDLDEVAFETGSSQAMDLEELARSSEEAPVVRLVNLILLDAIKRQASDIHVEPYEKVLRVRFRIDGVLFEVMNPPLSLATAIISRLKIMSSLDIAERRLPQDGRIKLRIGRGREMDFRVSVMPTLFGEKIVLRLLDKSQLQLDMTKLGFEAEPLKRFKEAIHRPFGMVLVTGPTGSGKTTTLYSALAELNKTTENISTAEDPVEFNLMGINQVQMNDAIGLNFATALRSFLRQDPDIIMVGEIRDFETAEIAVKAALTGHLVLSTLHTNDAPSTISRMLNMGIEPFLVTASVNLVVAQRLSRRVCSHCARPHRVAEQVLLDLQVPEDLVPEITVMQGEGCKYCDGTGYKGRVALFEVMQLTDELKDYILQGYSTAELKHEAIRAGMKTLRQTGIQKILEGVTTIDEVARNTAPD
ncbi:MAG: type IV-A pilus assembly ATPase PilB [Bradymonadales bacterium]|nr:type IV-A pilus assembly ATPase PilB [Bradymonadales bacterium]